METEKTNPDRQPPDSHNTAIWNAIMFAVLASLQQALMTLVETIDVLASCSDVSLVIVIRWHRSADSLKIATVVLLADMILGP